MMKLLVSILLLWAVTASAQQTEVNTARSIKLRGFKGLWLAPQPAWSPLNMPNLYGWWKADTITNLVNGSSVAFWTDSSGHNLHMVPATANSPYWTNGFQNSKPAVFFDGINDYMTNACVMEQTNVVVFVISHRIPDAGAASFVWASLDIDELFVYAGQRFQWAAGDYTNGLAVDGATLTVANTATNVITTYVVQFAANSGQVWTNGVSAVGPAASGTYGLTDGMLVGTSRLFDSFYKGYMLEMFCMTNVYATSGTTLSDVTTYLRHKYGHH